MDAFLELKSVFTDHPLFLLGLLLLVGYGVGKLALWVRLPEITGFILAGLLVSPFTTGVVTHDIHEWLHVVTEVAIGFLALTIGSEFSVGKLRRIGRNIAAITTMTLLGTFAVTLVGCLILDRMFVTIDLGAPYALLLAVIACATSPAMIVAEIHHLRAHGKFVDYLFGVVALTDAITVAVFGLAFTLVINLLGDQGSISLLGISLIEIVSSIVGGALAALPLAWILRRNIQRNELMIITMGYIFVLTGAAIALHLSPLLVNMAAGATLVNITPMNQRIFRSIEPLTPPIYALFFVIAGLEIDPRVFVAGPVLAAGGAYILLRGISKYATTYWSCRHRGIEEPITRYMGLCTFSQGGIALGFVLLIQTSPALEALSQTAPLVHQNFHLLVNIVLMSIFVNEVVSPIFLRYAVVRGNEMEL